MLATALVLARPGQAAAGYASLIIDADTGQVLHAVSADTRNHPASLTKMMTLYMLFEALDSGKVNLRTPLPVTARATIQKPSRLGVQVGQTIEVEDAILALVTKSANDVACVIAEALGGTEANFAVQMTNTARRLGMRDTVFRNASGLPNTAQITTARDMATLARALIRDYPKHYRYFATREFHYGPQTIPTHNRLLLSYDGADGIKTGYIAASGFNLVSSAKRDGHRLIGVVLGGRTARWRDSHMADLLDQGFARLNGRPVAVASRVGPPPKDGSSVVAAADDEDDEETPAKARSTKVPPPAKIEPVKVDAKATPRVAQATASGDLDRLLKETLQEGRKPKPGKDAKADAKAKAAAADDDDEEADDEWGIQLGSFKRADQAQAAARAVVGKLKEKPSVLVVSSKVKGATVYRARLMGMTRAQAKTACARAAQGKGNSCHIVHPSGELSLADRN